MVGHKELVWEEQHQIALIGVAEGSQLVGGVVPPPIMFQLDALKLERQVVPHGAVESKPLVFGARK